MQIEPIYQLYKRYPRISTDTRKELDGSLFFALRGEKFDANKFALQAIEKGAAKAIVDDPLLKGKQSCIYVKDSLKTLQELAGYHRNQLSIPIIAITGSNGKTTTKEILHRILKMKFNAFATPGNLNNHIGLPLSILKIDSNHELALLEIGANHTGENAFLTKIAQPTHGLTTNIGKDHLGEFGGMEGVIQAYKEFIDYFIDQESRHFFLNADDPELIKLIPEQQCIVFGQKLKEADYRGKIIENTINLKAQLTHRDDQISVSSNLFGAFNLYNILAAFAIGHYFGVGADQIKEAIESYYPENNRSQIVEWESNRVIFDAYNANPSSMQLALDDFENINHPEKVIILGSMFELGHYAQKEHKQIIEQLRKMNYSKLILVGKEFKAFKNDISCSYFNDVNGLNSWMKEQQFKNSLFLIKASRGEKLEKTFSNIL